MGEEQNPFAADPYTHQPDFTARLERQLADRELLKRVLGMSDAEVFAASKLYSGREDEFFSFLLALRFLDYVTAHELKEDAAVLKATTTIFTIEGVAPRHLGNRERLCKFLTKYLTKEEKLHLLHNFTFSSSYGLGAPTDRDRHLMFDAAMVDRSFREQNLLDYDPQYCSVGSHSLCFCSRWLREQSDDTINTFAADLAGRLYQMRCAVVHDATPVVFGEARQETPPGLAYWSMTLVDVFTTKGNYVRYSSGISVPSLVSIFRLGLRRCFEDGSRF